MEVVVVSLSVLGEPIKYAMVTGFAAPTAVLANPMKSEQTLKFYADSSNVASICALRR
jgi:hypothetical protein